MNKFKKNKNKYERFIEKINYEMNKKVKKKKKIYYGIIILFSLFLGYLYFITQNALFFVILFFVFVYGIPYVKKINNNLKFPSHIIKQNDTGIKGEKEFFTYGKNLLPNNYKILENIYLKNTNNNILQADSIIIGENNLYVIEIKNWYGKISGNLNNEKWVVKNNNTEKKYDNPYLQNKKHKKEIKKIINNEYYNKIYNFVVFMNEKSSYNLYQKNDKYIFKNHHNLFKKIINIENKFNNKKISQKEKNNIINSFIKNHYKININFIFDYNYKKLKKHNIYNKLIEDKNLNFNI